MRKTNFLIFILCIGITRTFSQDALNSQNVFEATKKVAEWQLHVLDTGKWKYRPTDWTFGAYYTGVMAWAQMAQDDRYLNFLRKIGEQNQWKGGPERFFADDYCVGQTYAQLFTIYRDPAMITEMKAIGDDIIARPHTESLMWNFEGGLHNREWAWCDALYMGPPMLAYLSSATGEGKYLDIANQLWWRTAGYLYDTSEHLFFRDSRFFQKREKNGNKVFWSRGNGWVIAAITRMLDNLPDNYKDRVRYIQLFKQMANRIAALQTPDGTWHVSLLDPQNYPSKETSGSAFFVYALSWGVNKGLLSYEKYFPVISKGWKALNECVHPDGKLGFVQVPGAAPEKVGYEDSEVYGSGAFLLAGTEVFKIVFNRDNAPLKAIISNDLPVNRKEEIVELPWKHFSSSKFSPSEIKIVSAQTGKEIPFQLTKGNGKKVGGVLFQSGVAQASHNYFYILREKPSLFSSQTYGRIVPERFDDFAWENDRVAFRMYGPALQANGEISSGVDVWGKRTARLVINDWYKRDDYHKDHGEGMDFYGVGTTLGAGGIAPFIKGRLYPSNNFVSYKVLENGPLRTRFSLKYAPWKAAGLTVSETKTITLDAGSFLNRMEINYQFSGPALPVAVGIATVPQGGPFWDSTAKVYSLMAYQQSGDYGVLNIGVIVPGKCQVQQIDSTNTDHYNHTGHVLLTRAVEKNKSLVYYQGAAWNQQGSIITLKEWKAYLLAQELRLKKPLGVTVKK